MKRKRDEIESITPKLSAILGAIGMFLLGGTLSLVAIALVFALIVLPGFVGLQIAIFFQFGENEAILICVAAYIFTIGGLMVALPRDKNEIGSPY